MPVRTPVGTATGTPTTTATAQPTPTGTLAPPSPPPTAAPTRTPTSTPSPSPTPSPTPTPTAPPPQTARAGPPIVQDFRANVKVTDPGDTITLTWQTSGATHARIYKLLYSGQLTDDYRDVSPTGSMTYTISTEERNWVNFLLYASDDGGRHDDAGLTVELRCPDRWFFSPAPEEICPTEPLVSEAAEQHFERGTMVWVGAEDAVYVLYAGDQMTTRWHRFPDEWTPDQPSRDPELTPPPGLRQPIRGFGLVWRTQPLVRERLGWAVDREQGYTTVMQRTTRYKYNARYLLSLDGEVWYLGPEGSSWDKLQPDDVHLGESTERP